MARFNLRFITDIDDDEVIIYGSNSKGDNAGGLAAFAESKGWTQPGHATGIAEGDKAYAIDTMSGTGPLINQFYHLYKFADRNKDKTFLLTPVGQGIAGYDRVVIETQMLRGLVQYNPAAEDLKDMPNNIVKIGW